jgi:hypothetical protein
VRAYPLVSEIAVVVCLTGRVDIEQRSRNQRQKSEIRNPKQIQMGTERGNEENGGAEEKAKG